MNTKVLLVVGVVGCAVADRRPAYSYSEPVRKLGLTELEHDYSKFLSNSNENMFNQDSFEYSAESSEAKYDLRWAVKDGYSGNDFGHQESRDGDYTRGSYYAELPDGRVQRVRYFVDGDSGYVAQVSYEGSAESREYGRPVYSRPRGVDSQARPVYSSPESEESFEVPVYASPRPIYGPPRPTYGFFKVMGASFWSVVIRSGYHETPRSAGS
ncbi:cuticle protein 18.6-like [Penaeus japonicus]|uniref:cuticle protein 18.6-like n=1 Tax=Penaeus japonicus TaxID=27405 RepID=UPI001C70C52C|nr:cuticle protein 18.6-like [Penaeus japonicus]